MITKLKAHCEVNHYPVGLNFREQVEDWCCASLIKNGKGDWCQDNQNPHIAIAPLRQGILYTTQQFIAGTATLAYWLEQGVPLVEQSVADTRARICITCPNNIDSQDCKSCGAAKAVGMAIQSVLGNKRPINSEQLHSCGICLCLLQIKVFAPDSIITKFVPKTTNDLYPSFCWAKRKDT